MDHDSAEEHPMIRTSGWIHATLAALSAALTSGTFPGQRFHSPYFEFAAERNPLLFKAVVQRVPDSVTDNMIYHCRRGVYSGRQIVYKGVSTTAMVQAAHGVSAARTVWNTSPKDARYIAEIIVPEKDRDFLQRTLRHAVDEELGLLTRREERLVPVYRLEVMQGRAAEFAPTSGRRIRWHQEPGRIAGVGLTMPIISSAIERMTGQRPEINSVDSEGHYRVNLTWGAGDIDDLRTKLQQVGLDLVPDVASIELLVVDPAPLSQEPR
jgi:uncharacterized protein (TIGR03435 family)